MGSGCDSSGRAGTSNTRSPQFKSDLKQFFIENLFAVYCIENKDGRGREWPLNKNRGNKLNRDTSFRRETDTKR